jgi:hypothetical protein
MCDYRRGGAFCGFSVLYDGMLHISLVTLFQSSFVVASSGGVPQSGRRVQCLDDMEDCLPSTSSMLDTIVVATRQL